jgi:hypothetical protein
MRSFKPLWALSLGLLLVACRKDHNITSTPPPDPVAKVLLKDIIISNLPSPYYHFEYNSDSMPTRVSFASGYTNYDVLYNGNTIAEMRNNIIVNHDTLRYLYDNAGKVFMITFINQSNTLYRHVSFLYNGDQVKEIDWDHKIGDVGFQIDRSLKFTYYPDGNLNTVAELRRADDGSVTNSAWQFEQYDDKINVDDFDLVHDGIHDHLFLFQGFRLQKNNPGREIFTQAAGQPAYTVDYGYTYNHDNTPAVKTGNLIFTDGPDAGKKFPTSTTYTYY